MADARIEELRALSPWVNTPTSDPLAIFTPAASAALKLSRLR
jgi:hypothetical protein